jgi:MoaA/NifB/PqqE/SkfB family radical SAM enzyme
MLTTITVCVTREFIDNGHLLPYLEFAKKLDVHFVQLLEPKAVGHYSGKDVLLKEQHVKELENFFITINSEPKYKDYPSVMYHGFHQRRMGCYTSSHSVYIDSIGDVHACPFCHTKSYNIQEIINAENKIIPRKENNCPAYEKKV